ncbi:MAG TPA: flagellar basal body rod protein FlgB [Rhodobacteraceae bacterium]|jgi:flagellar basal-body rod protein FlgB|nr:FlgB family protein [Paracoccaceae bacterium]HBG98546.1 flagellar basal body rod protein FlgB [Paracoccaceae bacterium]
MTQSLEILQMAQAAARHAAARQAVAARNAANADTPGYKARDIPDFAETYAARRTEPMRATRPQHLTGARAGNLPEARPVPTDDAAPNGNTVSLATEMLRSVEAERAHNRAVTIYGKSLDILRAAMGRSR